MTGKLALVTGATGAIGPTLVHQLLNEGYNVRTVSRHQPPTDLFPPAVESLQGDITDRAALTRAMQGVDVVFHLAALLHIENPPPDMASQYQAINVGGTQMVVDCARQAGVRRCVYFSTVKVYGLHHREAVDETTPAAPKTMYAQTKLQAEEVVRSSADIETVVLRLSAVYGPRLRGSWERMVKAIKKGWFLPIGNLQNRRSLTYVEDVACAAVLAATQSDIAGQTYNVVGHEGVTMHNILSAIYAALGKDVPSLHIPAFLALSGTLALEKGLALVGKRSPLTLDAVQQLVQDEVYSGEKLCHLGMMYTSLSEGWASTIQSL